MKIKKATRAASKLDLELDRMQRAACEVPGVHARKGKTSIPGFYEKGDLRLHSRDVKALQKALRAARRASPRTLFKTRDLTFEGRKIWPGGGDYAGQFWCGIDVYPSDGEEAWALFVDGKVQRERVHDNQCATGHTCTELRVFAKESDARKRGPDARRVRIVEAP